MAEPKDIKPKSDGGGDDTLNTIIFVFIGLMILLFVFERIYAYLNSLWGGDYVSIGQRTSVYFLQYIWPLIKVISVIVSGFAIFGIYRILKKFKTLRLEEKELFGAKEVSAEIKEEVVVNEKWQQIQTHLNSKNSSEWKLAIIEADIMLDELLKSCGYHGETVGDRLKAVEKSDFLTLEAAWEAHKIRNQIAHQGGDFEINDREARRVIALFESVFREFEII